MNDTEKDKIKTQWAKKLASTAAEKTKTATTLWGKILWGALAVASAAAALLWGTTTQNQPQTTPPAQCQDK